MNGPDANTQERVIDVVSATLMLVAAVPADNRNGILVAANTALKTGCNLILGSHYAAFVAALLPSCPGFHQNAFSANMSIDTVQAALALAFPAVVATPG